MSIRDSSLEDIVGNQDSGQFTFDFALDFTGGASRFQGPDDTTRRERHSNINEWKSSGNARSTQALRPQRPPVPINHLV